MLPLELLQILACPVCRSELVQRDDATLHCRPCCRDYPVIEGIPVLLPHTIDIASLKTREPL